MKQLRKFIMSVKSFPASGCMATKDDLIDDGIGETSYCPICRDDWEVLCRVSNHPTRHSTDVFPVPTSEGAQFFEFPIMYNDMLGRDTDAPPLRIFMREENVRIAALFVGFLASSDTLCYMLGPPGVGKMKESIHWMLQTVVKDPGSLWAWVFLPKGGGTVPFYKVYLLNSLESNPPSIQFKVFKTSNPGTDLHSWGVKVVLFGNCNESNKSPMVECVHDRLKTIAVSSVQMKFDQSFSCQQAHRVKGWTLDEYLEACKDADFYNSVKKALQTDDFTDDELDDPSLKEEVLSAKYHLAGGCARWMFQHTTEQLLAPAGAVVDSIASHVQRVTSDSVMMGIGGDRSVADVSQLLTRIDGKTTVVVSKYVANQLAFRFGEALLLKKEKELQLLMGVSNNPVMKGVLMEMDFMMRLGKSTPEKTATIDLVTEVGRAPERVFESGGKKIMFRFSTFDTEEFTVNDGDWLVPCIVNKGGFDCVQYRADKLIFVQLQLQLQGTRSVSVTQHSFNLKWYKKFFDAFTRKFGRQLPISLCEVWFVVPDGHMMNDFQPDDASSGTLPGYMRGDFKVAGMKRTSF